MGGIDLPKGQRSQETTKRNGGRLYDSTPVEVFLVVTEYSHRGQGETPKSKEHIRRVGLPYTVRERW